MEHADEAVSEERRQWLDAKAHALQCAVEISAIYHGKRARFLTACERLCQAIAALTATAAFSQWLGTAPEPGRWFALAAAVASILPMVFSWSTRANQHAILSADHKRLLARIVGAGHALTERQVTDFSAELRTIEAAEGASLGALVVQCQNELAIAAGKPRSVVPLRWWQRATMHCWDWHVELPELSDKDKGEARVESAG